MNAKALWFVLIAAISTGCCGVWLGCHGQEEEAIDNGELNQILDGKRPDVLSEPDASKVADLLAKAKDKEQALFNGISVGRLLTVSMHLDEHKCHIFCSVESLRSLDEMCADVSQNKYLDDYCTRGVARIRDICLGTGDWFYQTYVLKDISSYKREDLTSLHYLLTDIVFFAEQHCKTCLTPREIAEDYMDEIIVKKGIRPSKESERLCKQHNRLMKRLFVFDKGGKKTYKELMSRGKIGEANTGIFCDVLFGKTPTDDDDGFGDGEPWRADIYGNKYEATIELNDVKRQLDDRRPGAPSSMDEKQVAGLLAKAKDKRSAFFKGVSVEELLHITQDKKHRSYLCRDIGKSGRLVKLCMRVALNRYLKNYCTKGVEMLADHCANRGERAS